VRQNNIKNQLKSSIEDEKIEELKRKSVHEQFYRELEDHQQIKKNVGCVCMCCSSGLKGEKESLIIAAAGQALNAHYHHSNIMKQPIDSKCRVYCKAQEHIRRIALGCNIGCV